MHTFYREFRGSIRIINLRIEMRMNGGDAEAEHHSTSARWGPSLLQARYAYIYVGWLRSLHIDPGLMGTELFIPALVPQPAAMFG
jgi:hypothetical protein